MIVFRNIFCQLDKNDLGIYKSITRDVASQEDGYTAGCLIDFYIWKKKKKLIAISKQQALDPDTID